MLRSWSWSLIPKPSSQRNLSQSEGMCNHIKSPKTISQWSLHRFVECPSQPEFNLSTPKLITTRYQSERSSLRLATVFQTLLNTGNHFILRLLPHNLFVWRRQYWMKRNCIPCMWRRDWGNEGMKSGYCPFLKRKKRMISTNIMKSDWKSWVTTFNKLRRSITVIPMTTTGRS